MLRKHGSNNEIGSHNSEDPPTKSYNKREQKEKI
jgi:hypothetical protein